jgi:hypothetical protein
MDCGYPQWPPFIIWYRSVVVRSGRKLWGSQWLHCWRRGYMAWMPACICSPPSTVFHRISMATSPSEDVFWQRPMSTFLQWVVTLLHHRPPASGVIENAHHWSAMPMTPQSFCTTFAWLNPYWNWHYQAKVSAVIDTAHHWSAVPLRDNGTLRSDLEPDFPKCGSRSDQKGLSLTVSGSATLFWKTVFSV